MPPRMSIWKSLFSTPVKRTGCKHLSRKIPLALETLEDRTTPSGQSPFNVFPLEPGTDLKGSAGHASGNKGGGPDLVVNLKITSAIICDAYGVAQTAPVMGQMVFLRAFWNVVDSAGEQYIVRFSVDGVSLDSGQITNNGDGGYNWYRGGWYASPGSHSVVITVDGANQVFETDETDNQITLNYTTVLPNDLPAPFSLYTTGTLNQDWFINNYADVDPRPGQAADYLGGVYQYDGHDAHDSGPQAQFFNTQDMGMPLIASADGTVTEVVDGNFDRETSSNNRPGNYILLNHGNNWETLYYHAAANTIVVKVGDQVKRGQLLGFMGSSGSSTGTHIHWNPRYRGAVVETGYAPSTYWQSAPIYSGSAPTSGVGAGMTNFAPSYNELTEKISPINSFSTSESGTAYFWTALWNFKTTDTLTWRWIRPNGTFFESPYIPSQNYQRFSWWYWSQPLGAFQSSPGTWQVSMRLNGNEYRRYNFDIGASSVPSMKLSTSGINYLLDERSTPVDFGSVPLNGLTPTRTFTIQNHGNGLLTLSNLTLPTGFTLQSSFPASLAANSSTSFTIGLDPSRTGTKFGMIRFNTNDPDMSTMNFNVTGIVTGTNLLNAPLITLPGPAVAYNLQSLPRLLFPTATVTDSNSPNFNSGSLSILPALGADTNDRVAINSQGNGVGQIGISGSTVSYAGSSIGTFTGGTGTTPLVVTFNSNATPVAVQALLRQITYQSLLTASPAQLRRYYTVRLVDETGLVSNEPWKMVAQSGVKRAPTIPVLPNQNVTNGTGFNQAGSFTDSTGFSWSASVDYGDGSGVQPLTLTGNTFTLNHNFTAGAGNYTATVSVWNDLGGIETRTFQTTVLAPIQISSVQVNDGTAQRSRVLELYVNFSRTVTTIDPTAFSLAVVGGVGVIPTLNVSWNGTNTVATITFSGTGVVAGSIADGRYQLNVDSTKLQDNSGGILDGDANGLSGGTYAGSEFHRLFGDANGDARVNATDLILFRAALGTTTGSGGYSPYFDVNNDGKIDNFDFTIFRANLGRIV